MKVVRQANIAGGIASLVKIEDGFSAIFVKQGKIAAQFDGKDGETLWAQILRGENMNANNHDNSQIDNEKYKEVTHLIENTNNSIFLTGRAGTGKTTFLKNFLEKTELKSIIIAPTGIAALNAGGQTAHSLFKFPPSLIRPQDVKRVKEGRILRNIDLLVIDEISMVRSDLMDAIDRSLRLNRGVAKPFGGVRLLCVGDSAQLPPVVNRDDKPILEEWFGGQYFFDAPSIKSLDWSIIELTHAFRQTEKGFLAILDRLRNGVLTQSDGQVLASRVIAAPPNAEDVSVILTTTNDAARRINEKEMAELKTGSKIYQCEIEGNFDEKLFPTDGNLELKVGAKIMLLRNDPDRRWVNGSLAIVHDILSDKIKIKIGKYIHEVEPVSWERYQYDIGEDDKPKRKIIGVFKQLPVRPAWALTIHKAQGLTFDTIHVDFGRGAFSHGHTYVALSRCRTLMGLSLSRNLWQKDVFIDERAFALFDKAKFEDKDNYRIGHVNFQEI